MAWAWILIFCMSNVYAKDVHFYVDPNGSDSNSGTDVHSPFKTIAHAISEASRAVYTGSSLYVELLPGNHDLQSTVHVGQHHGNLLTIRSYNGQEVHVTGGRQVLATDLQSVTDPSILNALPQGSRPHVKAIDLRRLGITEDGSLREYGAYKSRTAPFEVFVNGQPLRLARWPNEGFINIASIPDGANGNRFSYNSSVPSGWSYLVDVYIYGYLYWSWADEARKVGTLDTRNMMVSLNSTSTNYGLRIGHWGAQKLAGYKDQGGYFRFTNVLSELDVPGEYYVDMQTKSLYVWIPGGEVKSSDSVYVSVVNTCFDLGSSRNVVFSNFIIEACRGRAIQGYGVNNIRITNMEIRNTGDYNVVLGGNSRNCYISKSIFHDGDGAVNIQGGSRKTLESSGNVVEDCVMYRFAREGAVGRNAVHMGGAGTLIRYNHMYIGQYTAVRYSGNEHVIEFNHIHDTCMNASDCGAIHTGRDWTYRGNQIRYNIVHNTVRLVPGADVRGVMLDDQVSGQIITNNVFYDNEIHVNIGGGRDNVINNNLMYKSTKASMQVDGRGPGRSDYASDIMRKLHAMPYKGPLWTSRYPLLAQIDSHNASLPEGNQIHRNLVYNTPHKPFIYGMSGWLNSATYFNVTDTGFSYGPGDHYDVNTGDLRIRCHAAEWANYVNFQQVITLNDVGPRYTVGPAFNSLARKTVQLKSSAGPCTTHAPARVSPMPAFLPDGSGQTPMFNVTNHGCWFHIDACTNDKVAIGTYRDSYGESHVDAGNSENACFQRAVGQWQYCGSIHDSPVAAVYGPTGATTFAGDGCFMAMYGCPKHGGPADGHVVRGKIYRDNYAEQHQNAAHNEANCLSRALVQWRWCGSHPNHPVTSLYRPTGRSVTAGAGCWIKITRCPKQPSLQETMFYDAVGATNSGTDDSKDACFVRAEDYWIQCGEDGQHPVTAYYRPLAASTTYPPAA